MLPPEDRSLSPFTGWSRLHWEHIADQLLAGIRAHATPRHALVSLPGERVGSSGAHKEALEGFARSFELGAFRLAGAGGAAPGDIAAWYSEGLRAGSERTGPEAWPRPAEVPETIVEAASIALALSETRPWIWEQLDGSTQGRLVEWLSSTRQGRIWQNNWMLFPVIIETFLKQVGAPHSQRAIDRGLDFVDSCYRGDGWYSDGTDGGCDYYVGWAIHFSVLMWCRLDGEKEDPARAVVYRDRTRRYLDQYRYLFAADGAPVYHGRSLTYRFATAAPMWAGALLDATPLSPGETRRLASGVLRYFVERGAIRDDVLTLGWHRAFLPMVEPYVGLGSPYWAGRAFLGLLLRPDDPEWTAVEEPCAVEQDDFCIAMPAPRFLVRGTRADGIVRVANHAPTPSVPRSEPASIENWSSRVTRRAVERSRAALHKMRYLGSERPPLPRANVHYRKLAYSSHTSPDEGRSADLLDLDSQLVIVGGGDNHLRRARLHDGLVFDRFGFSVSVGDRRQRRDRIETVTIARGAAEVRVHHITTATGQAVRDGGYAIAGEDPLEDAVDEHWSMVRRPDGLTSFAGMLAGFEEAGTQRTEGANAFGRHSATPFLVSVGSTETERVAVALIVLTADAFHPDTALEDFEVAIDGREVTVTCIDGECFYVQLVAPKPVDRDLAGQRISGRVRAARVSPDGSSFTRLA